MHWTPEQIVALVIALTGLINSVKGRREGAETKALAAAAHKRIGVVNDRLDGLNTTKRLYMGRTGLVSDAPAPPDTPKVA